MALRVLIAGGGVAALEAMLALRALAEERVEVELLAPDRDFVYRPLTVAEPFGLGSVHRFKLEAIADACRARVHPDALARVDAPDAHRVETESGEELGYDVLLIAAGARTRETLPGALVFAGSEDVEPMRGLLHELRDGVTRHVVFALPSGVTWPVPLYELALLTAAQLGEDSEAELALATPEREPLELFGNTASAAVRQLLAERRITLNMHASPRAIEGAELRCAPGGRIRADRVVALPQLRGPAIVGCPQAGNDFIPTDLSGRVEGLADV